MKSYKNGKKYRRPIVEDKTARIIVESNNDAETCNITIENANPTTAIYMATKLVTAVAKQFSKDDKHIPLLVNAMRLAVHDQCKSATLKFDSEEVLAPHHKLS